MLKNDMLIYLDLTEKEVGLLIDAIDESMYSRGDLYDKLVLELEIQKQFGSTLSSVIEKMYYQCIKREGIAFSLKIPTLRIAVKKYVKVRWGMTLDDDVFNDVLNTMISKGTVLCDLGKAMSRRKGDFVRYGTAFYFITMRKEKKK